MNRSLIPVLALLAAACGPSMWKTATVATPKTVPQAWACADSTAKSLGYTPFQSKPTEGFLRARKNLKPGPGEIFDHIPYDLLVIQVNEGGTGATITVEAQSWMEQISRDSRTQVEKPSRPAVIADGQAVLAACGTEQVRSDRVPSAN
jgi:hypothetical protein